MITVAVIAPQPGDTTSLYRAYGPFGHLERHNPDIRVKYLTREECAEWHKFQNVDVVFMQRPGGKGHVDAILALKQYGCKVWVDYDDDYFHVNSDNKGFVGTVGEEFQNSILGCIKSADIVTVSTDALAKTIKQKVERAIVVTLKNAVDFRWWDGILSRRLPKAQRVNWRGLDSHHRDLQSVESEILELAFNNRDWMFGFYGWNPWFITDKLEKRFDYFKAPIFKYHTDLALSGGKVGIVPLLDNAFNRAKSNIAWLELSLTGHGVVAASLPEFYVPGCETYKSGAEFKDKVKAMMDNYEKHVRTSVEFIEANYNLKNWNKKRVQILEGLTK